MLQTKEKRKSEQIFSVILTVLLLAFLGLVFYVNLSCNPEYYDGDIYADIEYAKQAWKAKSLFPQNWVFGNQTYVVATPALAAIIYGIINNAVLAMGIASCIMTVLIVLTYDWMTKTLFSYNERTAGFLSMAGLILIKDHIATGVRGAQLFFTMASYYSCYVITAFVVFGCYIRIRQGRFSAKHIAMAVIGVALSFGTGMQSLRQTAVMVLPLVACEIIEIILDSVRKKKLCFSLSSLFTAVVFLFNILGIFVMKTIYIEQITMYRTQISFDMNVKEIIVKTISAILTEIIPIFQSSDDSTIKDLMLPAISLLIMLSAFIANIVKQIKNKTEEYAFTLNIALILGCASIFSISIFTSFSPREIYYFMFFPLLAQSIATILKATKKYRYAFESVIAVAVVAILLYRCVGTVKEIRKGTDPKNTEHQIADYLTDNGYEALYHISGFSWRGYLTGEDVIVSSGDKLFSIRIKSVHNWEIDAPITRSLCIKNSYKLYPDEKSIYLFNEKDLTEAKEYCNKYGIEISVVKQFEDRYLCKLSTNLIAFSEKKGQHEQQN